MRTRTLLVIGVLIIGSVISFISIFELNIKQQEVWGQSQNPPPVLISPKNNEVITDRNPDFSWTGMNEGNIVIVDDDKDLSSILYASSTPPRGSNNTLKDGGPPNGFSDGKYFWVVLRYDQSGNGHKIGGSISSTFSFTIKSDPTVSPSSYCCPSTAYQISPKVDSRISNKTVLFDWMDSFDPDGIGRYDLTILDSTKKPVVSQIITGSPPPSQIQLTTPVGSEYYQWSVKSYDRNGNLMKSTPDRWQFYTTNIQLSKANHINTTSLSLDLTDSNKITTEQTYTIFGNLIDTETNLPITGKEILVRTDGSSPLSDTTDSKGNFNLELTAPRDVGEHKIQAHFEGDKQYDPSDSPVREITVKDDDSQTGDDETDNSQEDNEDQAEDDGTSEDDSSIDD